MRTSMNFGLLLVVCLFTILLVPSRGWAAQTTNCPTEPAQNVPIASGQTYYGSNCVLMTTGDVDGFQFSGSAGDIYRLVASAPGIGYPNNVCIALYAPGLSSAPIFSGCSNTFNGSSSVATDQKLPLAGSYTIAVSETLDATTNYGLSLERLYPAPPDGITLVLSQNVASAIDTPTAQDAFTFYGATTGTYEIGGSLTTGGYPSNFCFDVFQPDGTNVLRGQCTNTFNGGSTVQTDITPVQNGTYVVVAYESSEAATIGYNLEVSCLLGTCPSVSTSPSFSSVSGALTQISVGADGSIWGLNSSQQIFTYGSSGWTNIPGALLQIAVGSSDAVWGLNEDGQIYHWDSVHSQWIDVPGALAQIAVGADGDVWGLDAQSNIYHYNAQIGSFVEVPGQLAHLAVGSAGAVYGINSSGAAFWYNPGTGYFQYLANPAFTEIAVGADGFAIGLSNGVGYGYKRGAWYAGPSEVPIAQVAVGSGGSIYGLDASGNVYYYNAQSQALVQIPGTLSSIAVGGNGAVWGLNSSQEIFQLQNAPMRPYQTLTSVPGSLSQISVGADGSVWGVSGNTGEYFNPGTQTFLAGSVPPALAQISVGAGGDVWALDTSGSIYEWDASSNSWNNIPGQLNFIQVGADNSVWGINSAGLVFTYNFSNNTWANIPGALQTLSVGADGTVWGLNAQQQIYRFDGVGSWVNVPGALVQISVGDANNVWGVNAEQQIYRYDLAGNRWVSVPGTLMQVKVAFDGSVWGVNAAGDLYQWNASAQSFSFVGSGVTDVFVGNAAAVWAFNATTGAVFSWF